MSHSYFSQTADKNLSQDFTVRYQPDPTKDEVLEIGPALTYRKAINDFDVRRRFFIFLVTVLPILFRP
jgi:hypothetical protein